MSEHLQTLLKEALLNNSYDYDVLHDSLKKIWMNSYSYLYYLQKANVGYEELFFYSNETDSRNSKLIGKLYLDSSLYANFDVDCDFIGLNGREEFRLSDFYQNTFAFEDMVYHTDIFNKVPIVIIDDKVIWDYKIRVKKDSTTFTLPFRRNFVLEDERNASTDDIIYIDHKIQVLLVDNIFYQRYEYNKYSLYFNANTKTFKIGKEKMLALSEEQITKQVTSEYMKKHKVKYANNLSDAQKVAISKEIKRRVKCIEIPEQDGIMFATLHMQNVGGKGYELGTSLIRMEDDGEGFFVGHLTDDQVTLMRNQTYKIYVSMMFVNRLYEHTFYTGKNTTVATENGANLMVLEQSKNVPYKSPIPEENFMVFKINKETSGWYLEKNTDMIEHHYPNIYRIKDDELVSGDEYRIFYFYYNNPDLQYTVLFDFYFKFLLDIFSYGSLEEVINNIYYNTADLSMYEDDEKIRFEKTFKKIMDYKFHHHQYGDTDFLIRYLKTSGNEDKEPIEYKDETMKEWIKIQPWVLRDYVLDQNKVGASYHLFTNTLDLPSRIRTDTSIEMQNPHTWSFDEERYVFAFANEREYPALLDCRVFVDGILIGDVYQERRLFMDYFYVPTRYVTEDSYIELEVFPRYQFEKEIEFSSLDESIEVTIAEPTENIYPTTADLILAVDKSDGLYDYLSNRFSKDQFKITSHYDRGNFEVSSDDENKPVKFTRLSTFDIQPIDEDVLNVPIKLKFSKVPIMVRFTMDEEGYAYIDLGTDDFQFSSEYVRVYRNGRLVPSNRYRLMTTYKRARMIFIEWFDLGDIIYIDITPYRYRQVYYKEEISKDETLIDLRGIINKPFDIRYYDVYMNGRKLSLNNVFSITPWSITLVNLKSNYNLDIYEKERDWEYFGLDYTENIYYFTLTDLLESGIVKDEEFGKLIKDRIDELKDDRLNIYPNTNDEEPIDYSDEDMIYPIFYIFYYDELIPKTYVNPDILQFSLENMLDTFPEILDNYMVVPSQETSNQVEKYRRKDYPSVVCLDPDILVLGPDSDEIKTITLQLKDRETDDVTYDEDEVVIDVERVPDETQYAVNENPLVYSLDNQATIDEQEEELVEGSILVYEVGHTDDVEQELLDTEIEIPFDDTIIE